jgi:hypothetical protein
MDKDPKHQPSLHPHFQRPRREEFQDEEEYLEAVSGWDHRIGKVLALRRRARNPSKGSPQE